MTVETWLLFARKKADDALTAIGTITSESAGVEAGARKEFGEDWLEMVAIPRAAAVWAIEEE